MEKKIGSKNHINLAALYELIIFPLYFLKIRGLEDLIKLLRYVSAGTHIVSLICYTHRYTNTSVCSTPSELRSPSLIGID